MHFFQLDGLWLFGALLIAFVLGILLAQKIKDFINGIPSDLRSVLKTNEQVAVATITKAQADALAALKGTLAPVTITATKVEAKVAEVAAPVEAAVTATMAAKG
jgi:hypothetical protein